MVKPAPLVWELLWIKKRQLETAGAVPSSWEGSPSWGVLPCLSGDGDRMRMRGGWSWGWDKGDGDGGGDGDRDEDRDRDRDRDEVGMRVEWEWDRDRVGNRIREIERGMGMRWR